MRIFATKRKIDRDRDISRTRLPLLFTAMLLILGYAIFGSIYWYAIPILTGFDPCLSSVFARQEDATIRTRYEAFRALVKADRYEEAYQYMTRKYQREHGLGDFKDDTAAIHYGMWGTELRPDSSIFVCEDTASLTNVKYEGFISYAGFASLVKLDGQWYFDVVSYAQD